MSQAQDCIDVSVWVFVDAEGRAVSDCNPDHLRDEYEADFSQEFDPKVPARVVKLTLRVRLPRAQELSGEVPDQVTGGVSVRIA